MSNNMTHIGGRKMKGYTLIEMLISITILSGLLIITLGIVATSSSSSAKVSVLREKSQATRTLVDQISNDLRYVDTNVEFKESDTIYRGYLLEETSKNRLVLALHLPKADPNFPLVRKEYTIQTYNDHLTLTLLEKRKCNIDPDLTWFCDSEFLSPITDLLSTTYSLNQGATNDFLSEFSGLMVVDAENDHISPFVSIDLTVKPSDVSLDCTNSLVDAGTCYEISTTINMGSSR
ncbi:MAG: type II secretion system GspH family protein [Candidatus Berkelbacteria bacterium]|nr:type II secretion system GspH family protein [Candidatus Berkelbacteria bacterium]